MENSVPITLKKLIAQIEETWDLLDQIFDEIEAENLWTSKHGDDWTFADVPYHISYIDRELTLLMIENGPDLPDNQQWQARTPGELNTWNKLQFSKRSEDQTISKTLKEMQKNRQAVKDLLANMGEEDLDRPAWFPLLFRRGWRTVRAPLMFCRDHNWIEFMQMRILLGKKDPIPSPSLSHDIIHSFMHYVCSLFDPEQAEDQTFKVVWRIEGTGEWSIIVEDGSCRTLAGETASPDAIINLNIDSFVQHTKGMLFPQAVMTPAFIESADNNIPEKFNKLFPALYLDRIVEPAPYY